MENDMENRNEKLLKILKSIFLSLFVGIACAAIILCCHAIFGDMGTAVSLAVIFLVSMVLLEYRDGD